jgi:hypothetical protein
LAILLSDLASPNLLFRRQNGQNDRELSVYYYCACAAILTTLMEARMHLARSQSTGTAQPISDQKLRWRQISGSNRFQTNNSYLFFSNTILFLFVIDTHYEKQPITPLGFVKFFRPPHC